MDFNEVAEDLKAFIAEEANIVDSTILERDLDLFGEGLIDSMMIITIILYCNEKYGCDLSIDSDFETTIRTINGISSFICNSKMKGGANDRLV